VASGLRRSVTACSRCRRRGSSTLVRGRCCLPWESCRPTGLSIAARYAVRAGWRHVWPRPRRPFVHCRRGGHDFVGSGCAAGFAGLVPAAGGRSEVTMPSTWERPLLAVRYASGVALSDALVGELTGSLVGECSAAPAAAGSFSRACGCRQLGGPPSMWEPASRPALSGSVAAPGSSTRCVPARLLVRCRRTGGLPNEDRRLFRAARVRRLPSEAAAGLGRSSGSYLDHGAIPVVRRACAGPSRASASAPSPIAETLGRAWPGLIGLRWFSLALRVRYVDSRPQTDRPLPGGLCWGSAS
jgi:hypothetical protein